MEIYYPKKYDNQPPLLALSGALPPIGCGGCSDFESGDPSKSAEGDFRSLALRPVVASPSAVFCAVAWPPFPVESRRAVPGVFGSGFEKRWALGSTSTSSSASFRLGFDTSSDSGSVSFRCLCLRVGAVASPSFAADFAPPSCGEKRIKNQHNRTVRACMEE